MPEALVMVGDLSTRVCGMTLSERAVRLVHRAGFSPILVCGETSRVADLLSLVSRIAPVSLSPDASLSKTVSRNEGVLIVGPDTLFEPKLLTDLVTIAGQGNHVVAVDCRPESGRLVFVPPTADTRLFDGFAANQLATALGPISDGGRLIPGFCRAVTPADDVGAIERAYIRHLNGQESYFTKKIRRFSVPLSQQLVRLGAAPTQVTASGFVLAAASASCIAQGSYLWGVSGALLYYASMVFDCSDGEVARVTLKDSPFGAWLETFVDYLTYVLLLAGLVWAVRQRPGAGPYLVAASIAVVGSLVVIGVAAYLRQRVAAADPGQFDDASANAMESAGHLNRFARWGRQWIKRSSIAHLAVALALVNALPLLLYLWAFGATVAAAVIVAVTPFVLRRVSVQPPAIRHGGAPYWSDVDD